MKLFSIAKLLVSDMFNFSFINLCDHYAEFRPEISVSVPVWFNWHIFCIRKTIMTLRNNLKLILKQLTEIKEAF